MCACVMSLRYYVNYNESREELEVAAEEFQEGIEQWVREQLRKFFFGFIRAVIKLAFGIFPCGAAVSLNERNSPDCVIYVQSCSCSYQHCILVA